MIQLPQLKHNKSGLVKRGKIWRILYYQDGKLKSTTSNESTLKKAMSSRDLFHTTMIERKGATYKGGTSDAVNSAIDNPDGDDCIYTQTSYRVMVEGVHITTTTDKSLARQRRNEYLADTYHSQ
jgi:hypothetical protein|tara:strand:+ start:2980 stop:3351 length:372 start_codon:yes stop_codon:yes gene_type:complete